MTAREYEELKALGRMERIGQERKDFGVWATVASMGFKGTVKDLFPFDREQPEQTQEEMFLAMSSLAVKQDGSQHSNAGD